MSKKFIIASSKLWHKENFEKFTKISSFEWHYVSSPEDLEKCLSNGLKPKYIFFLHWHWKVPKKTLKTVECICFHMTDLPYGRGGSPLQNLILQGKQESQITAFKMTEEIDAGPIYLKRPVSLIGRAEDIYARVGILCWDMLNWIIANDPVPQMQIGSPTIFDRRTPEQSILPKKVSVASLYDFIRMLDAPDYPKAFLEYGNFKIEFSYAQLKENLLEARVSISIKDTK